MHIAVNAVSLSRFMGGPEVFVHNFLHVAKRVQPDVRFTVIVSAENEGAFLDWSRQPAESERDAGTVAAKAGADALLSPLEGAVTGCPIPQCVLAMNMQPYTEPPKKAWGLFRKDVQSAAKRVLGEARSILAPSEFVKRELLDKLELPLEKIVVAPLGVDPVFDDDQTPFIEPPYILTVGSTVERRNLPVLLDAMNKLNAEERHSLVVVGRAGDAEPAGWGPGVMRIEQAPKNHLAGLYQHASLTVLPSVYEGSGVTVLEALRAGSVVVCGRVGGVAEAAHNAPLYFNPENSGTLVAAMKRAMGESAKERKARVDAGRKLAKAYSWEDCVWKTLHALKK